jgi:hypothetical protein
VFAIGALLMAWDFTIKARPLLPRSVGRWIPGAHPIESPAAGAFGSGGNLPSRFDPLAWHIH